jgi:hypothetical protein
MTPLGVVGLGVAVALGVLLCVFSPDRPPPADAWAQRFDRILDEHEEVIDEY